MPRRHVIRLTVIFCNLYLLNKVISVLLTKSSKLICRVSKALSVELKHLIVDRTQAVRYLKWCCLQSCTFFVSWGGRHQVSTPERHSVPHATQLDQQCHGGNWLSLTALPLQAGTSYWAQWAFLSLWVWYLAWLEAAGVTMHLHVSQPHTSAYIREGTAHAQISWWWTFLHTPPHTKLWDIASFPWISLSPW